MAPAVTPAPQPPIFRTSDHFPIMVPIWLLDVLAPLDAGRWSALFVVPVALLALTRVLMTFIEICSRKAYKAAVPDANQPLAYQPSDISVVCIIEPSANLTEFQTAVQSWQAAHVACAIVVIDRSNKNYDLVLRALSNATRLSCRLIFATDEHALVTACNQITTTLIAISPPEVIWTSPSLIDWMAEPMTQPSIGIVAPYLDVLPVRSGRLTVREIAFDMALSRRNASLQAYAGFSSTLSAFPSFALVRTSIVHDRAFQSAVKPKQAVADCMWRWLMRSHWDFAFQKAPVASACLRCPNSWTALLRLEHGFGQRLSRAAAVLTTASIWRRHGLLAIQIILDFVDIVLVLYLVVGLVLIPILQPRWISAGLVVVLGVLGANLGSMMIYWSPYPADLIYFPLYLSLTMGRFCLRFLPERVTFRCKRQCPQPTSLRTAATLEQVSVTDKKAPVLLIPDITDKTVFSLNTNERSTLGAAANFNEGVMAAAAAAAAAA